MCCLVRYAGCAVVVVAAVTCGRHPTVTQQCTEGRAMSVSRCDGPRADGGCSVLALSAVLASW